MSKLFLELQRLYARPTRSEAAENELTRVMMLRFKRPSDWQSIAKLYEALQAEHDLPAPAVSVSPQDGFQLWLSLAEPVSVARAQAFLTALRNAYLGELAPASLELVPASDCDAAPPTIDSVPALDSASGRWSAFIDPSMGSVFIDEPGLEMAPNFDRQAQLLSQLKSIQLTDFERVLDSIASPDDAAPLEAPDAEPVTPSQCFSDPRSYLMAVINDPAQKTKHRIKAAKALLPNS